MKITKREVVILAIEAKDVPYTPWQFSFTQGAAEKLFEHFYNLGFSLYEHAWTLRGMENLMMDFIEHPEFAEELLKRIADFNIELIRRALKLDKDVWRSPKCRQEVIHPFVWKCG